MGREEEEGKVRRLQGQNECRREQTEFRIEIYAPKNPHTELGRVIRPRVRECWREGGEEEEGVSAGSIALERERARPRGLQIRNQRT